MVNDMRLPQEFEARMQEEEQEIVIPIEEQI